MRTVVAAGVALLFATSAAGAEKPPEFLASIWRDRAAKAIRKLAKGGLDECDHALEEAFRDAQLRETPKVAGGFNATLRVKIGAETAVVLFFYEGRRLVRFVVGALPAGWTFMQKPDSKTVTFAPGPTCVFDLCASDPTAEGGCAEPRRR